MLKWNPSAPTSTIKASIDTNLFVRALLGSPSALRLLEIWRADQFILIFSEELAVELFEVLARPKFAKYFSMDDIAELGSLIFRRAQFVMPQEHFTLCRDAKDNILLDAVIAAQAQYLVTADNDLLEDNDLRATMSNQYSVLIVSISEFLNLISEAPAA